MIEKELLELWSKARAHIIVSQLAPTFLLAVSVIALESGVRGVLAAKLAAAGILLASGVLGFIAQYSSASEALAIAADLRRLPNPSAVTKRIINNAGWSMTVVRFVTPAIFVLIFIALIWALFS